MELTVCVDRIEGNIAHLQLSSGETILWPASQLPEGIHESDMVKITVMLSKNSREHRQKKLKG
jgi:hypothetical protein